MGYQGMPAALLDLSRQDGERELKDSDAEILLLIYSTALGAEWSGGVEEGGEGLQFPRPPPQSRRQKKRKNSSYT
jgi:hypothetical protein